jgi:hypothetical protein
MARKNVQGVCKLCQKPAKLCKSHYLGRVLHKISFTEDEPPVMMTPKTVQATPRQLWAHLLCENCEQRLNEKGEKPVIALFTDANNNFPLLNRMELALPLTFRSAFRVSEGGLLVRDADGSLGQNVVKYSGRAMGINTEALAYYGLGILWKGSVHKWKTIDGQESTVDLGKYQEPIRRYLLGEAGFPDGVYVLVSACTDVGSQGMCFAPHLVEGSRYPMHSILIRGLWFHIITTDQDADGLSELCCVRSTEKVLFKEDCTERFLHAGRHIHETAAVSPELRKPTTQGTQS